MFRTCSLNCNGMNSLLQKCASILLFCLLLNSSGLFGQSRTDSNRSLEDRLAIEEVTVLDSIHGHKMPACRDDSLALARRFSTEGQQARQDGMFPKSLICFQRALDLLSPEPHDPRLSADILLEVGLIHTQLDHDSIAQMYFVEAQRANEALEGRQAELSRVFEGMGTLHYQNERFEEALHYFLNAVSNAQRGDDLLRVAQLYTEIGSVFRRQERYSRAKNYLAKAGDILRSEAGMEATESHRLLMLAEVFLAEQAVATAIDTAQLALSLAERSTEKTAELEAIEFLHRAHQTQKDPSTALALLERAYNLRNDIWKAEKEETVFLIEQRYQNKEKEDQIMLLEQQQMIQKLEISQQRSTLFFAMLICAILLLLLVTALVAYRNKQRTSKRLADQHRQIERQHSQLQQVLREKEILMYELHHRTKNNLNYLTSLLGWQSRQIQDGKATQVINESRSRLHAISLIHQHLYNSQQQEALCLRPYLVDLIQHLQAIFDNEHRVQIRTDLQDLPLDIHQAVPLGLIVNEAITNAYKHAFPEGKHGTIQVQMNQIDENLHLRISDNGAGLANSSSTPRLIAGLVRQLHGQLEIRNEGGTVIGIRIPAGVSTVNA